MSNPEHKNPAETGGMSGRGKLNFWVDVVTGIVFAAMVGSGILAKWILPPGSRGGAGYVWLGQGRHFWGDVHFWLGIALLALVILHIWLHWGWVVRTWARLIGRLGSPLTWAMIILLLVLILLPLVVPRQFSESYLEEHEQQEEASNPHLNEDGHNGSGGGGGGQGRGTGGGVPTQPSDPPG